jgi:hypothetical protein
VFSFMVFILSPKKLISFAQANSWCVTLNSDQLDFLGLSWWHILRQNWRTMAIQYLLDGLLGCDTSVLEGHAASVFPLSPWRQR